jgi:hypothetical protein
MGRRNPARWAAAWRMEQIPENVIFSYTDAQALADGVLVSVHAPPVNRVTRAVFDHFMQLMGSSDVTGPVFDIAPVKRVIEAMVALTPDEGGWRCGSYEARNCGWSRTKWRGSLSCFPRITDDRNLRLAQNRPDFLLPIQL